MGHPWISEPRIGRIVKISGWFVAKRIYIGLQFIDPRLISSRSNEVTKVKFRHFRYIRDVIATLVRGQVKFYHFGCHDGLAWIFGNILVPHFTYFDEGVNR